jgi:hypothetical protein
MKNSIPIISEWKEELMYGRLKKGFTKDESIKQIYQTENYKIVSYPAMVKGKITGNLIVELQHNNPNDVWNTTQIQIIKKHLPQAHFDKYNNVYPSSKVMRKGVKLNPMLDIFRLQQIQIELEQENILQKSLDILKA